MASVRLSKELRDRILNTAMLAFRKTNPDPKPTAEFCQKLVSAINNSPVQAAVRRVLQAHTEPNGVVKIYKSFSMPNLLPQTLNPSTFKLQGEPRSSEEKGLATGRNYGRDPTPALQLVVDMPAPVMVFHAPDRYKSDSDTLPLHISDLDEADQQPILDEMVRLLTEEKLINEKFSNYRSSIRDLLDKCNTAHQFVEAWPAGDAFLDTDTKLSMHEKVTRAQSARNRREAVNFDSTVANQVVLTSKLIGA
tara:strand:+ start:2721 stop:3470 length:750 start_codon:yes stop_codon:yes gene_type:complete